MPNRILREGILTSERVNALDWDAEVFYRRLMSVVDDFGRYTANSKLLRAALYPLQIEKVRDANIAKWLDACVRAGLVRVYAQSGASGDRCGNQSTACADRSGGDKRFLEMRDFRQLVRAKDSKYPHPPADARHVHDKGIANATHPQADALLDGVGVGVGVGDEDEDEDDIPTHPPIGEGARENAALRMFVDWKPSPHLSTLAHQAGLPMPDTEGFNAAVGEFIAYWLTQTKTRTQHEWDHALVKSLKADRMRDETTAQTEIPLQPRTAQASPTKANHPIRPDDVCEQTWDDWQKLRKAKRAPVTLTVLDGARQEADKAGLSLDAFLKLWCMRGSQGLQADWLKPGERAQGQRVGNPHKHAAAHAAIFDGVLDA